MRQPKCNSADSCEVRKGAWGEDEDDKLHQYVETHGPGHWGKVGKKAGKRWTVSQCWVTDFCMSGPHYVSLLSMWSCLRSHKRMILLAWFALIRSVL